MTREKVITIWNDLLQGKGNLSEWLDLISCYVNFKDKTKTDTILKIFPTLPQNIQARLVAIALNHFGKEFNVCSVSVKVSVPIILGTTQEDYKPILYY